MRQPPRIAHRGNAVRGNGGRVHAQATFREPVAERVERRAQQLGQVDVVAFIADVADVGVREIAQIIDETCQCSDLDLQRLDRLGRQRTHAVLQRFQLAAQDGERRAQFVRDVR